jgi:hypothetical protein|uniref:hypothetical protein n=1 Tax=Bradyrhizobium erythrophlei TaxID=1437360 RepID=UPI0009A844CD|nr:hypothetical protein [Bradyrhizobium erythrophlei]
MTDLFKLILGILASRFKARATLEAENLRQQVNVLRRRTPKATAPQQYGSFSICLAVCTENLIRVDAVMESPKLAE